MPLPLTPTRAGDALLLLMPAYDEAAGIRARLSELQQRFSGSVGAPLHLVCQQLRAGPEGREALRRPLQSLSQKTPPLEIWGRSIEPYYSRFHQRESLKCHIEVSEALSTFLNSVNETLELAGLEPLQASFDPRMTLLEDVKPQQLSVLEYRQRLFTARRLVLAEVRAPGRYRAHFSLPLGQRAAADPGHEEVQLDWW